MSLFADPYGSFTTAGAMVACVEKLLREKKQRELKGARIVIYGATGVVGYSAGVIAALEGADVTMVGYSGLARVQKLTEEIEQRFGVKVKAADGSTPEQVRALLIDHEIALCAARAGVQVLSKDDLAAAKNLLIAADVNAVPPLGVEGCGLHDNGVVISSQRGAGHRRFGHWQREIRHAVGTVQTDDGLQQAAVPRFPGRLRARPHARLNHPIRAAGIVSRRVRRPEHEAPAPRFLERKRTWL